MRIKNTVLISFVLLFSILLASCVTIKYKHNNISYDSPEPALAALKSDIDAILSKVTETKTPIGGSAVVILPSPVYVKKNIIVWKGTPPTDDLREKLEPFYAEYYLLSHGLPGEGVERRRIFDKVEVINSDDPENVPFNSDVALILSKKEGDVRWFIKRKRDKPVVLTEIEEVTTSFPPVQRMLLWLDNVEKAARGPTK
ncbi:MAG: hypothetical protein HZA12_06540 [Nitrospirae bacterium]|nr:hypothetical protein [Nitrospirota bacterium]